MARSWALAVLMAGCWLGPLDGQDQTATATYNGKSAADWIGQLAAEDHLVRRRAVYVLGRLDPPPAAAIDSLVELLKDRYGIVRSYAMYALGRIGPKAAAAVGAIIESVQNPENDQDFRYNGVKALGRIGPAAKSAEPLLLSALKSPDATYRVEAAVALWKISQHPAALPAVLEVLRAGRGNTSDETADDAAYDATMSLLQFGSQAAGALPDLILALGSPHPDVRRAAVTVLASLGTLAVDPIVAALEENSGVDPRAAADALGLILEDVRINTFYRPETTEAQLLEVAARLHSKVVPVLGRFLFDPQPEVRLSAARALARLGPSSVPVLLSALRSENPRAKQTALDALERLESYLPQGIPVSPGVERIKQQSLPALIETLKSHQPEVREAALRIFAALEIGSYGSQAAPLLRQFLRHEDPRVRRDAARALERIQEQPTS